MENWFVTLISAFLSAGVTIWVFNHSKSNILLCDRHEKLIAPIFFLMEPYLFKPITPKALQALNKAHQIHLKNSSISDGKLLEKFDSCFPFSKCTQKSFNAFCGFIDIGYDLSCKKLGLPVRSVNYKFKKEQYESKFYAIMEKIKYELRVWIPIFFVSIMLMYLIIVIFTFVFAVLTVIK